jgi:hypothetical protein
VLGSQWATSGGVASDVEPSRSDSPAGLPTTKPSRRSDYESDHHLARGIGASEENADFRRQLWVLSEKSRRTAAAVPRGAGENQTNAQGVNTHGRERAPGGTSLTMPDVPMGIVIDAWGGFRWSD